ncbi:hypothetical protein [Thalassotalea fusca]
MFESIAALLLVTIGLIHSILGEKYLISRLLRRENLPKLLESDVFTKQLIRFAWHLTSIAWWAIAAILWVIAMNSTASHTIILNIVAITFGISGLVALLASKGKHLSWIVFFAIGLCCLCANYL